MQRLLRSKADYSKTLLRNQLTSLVLYEAVTTTDRQAKNLLSYANRFFNRVKAADLNAKKLAHRTLFSELAIKKVFEEILPRYEEKTTNYLTTYIVSPRRGDHAAQRLVTLLKTITVEKEIRKPKKETAPKTKASVTVRSKRDKKEQQ